MKIRLYSQYKFVIIVLFGRKASDSTGREDSDENSLDGNSTMLQVRVHRAQINLTLQVTTLNLIII